MNIFNKIAFQEIKNNRARTLVTIIGVVLSAALITAVSTFVFSLQQYMVNGALKKYGNWHVEYSNVDASFIRQQFQDEMVCHVASFENIGYALLEHGKNPDKPYLFIAGFNKETFQTLPVNLISGRLPETSGEIVIPAHIASNGGVKIKVGDTLTLPVGIRLKDNKILSQLVPYSSGNMETEEILKPMTNKTYTVVGICQRPSFESVTAPGYTLITVADTANAENSMSAFITLKAPWQVHTYAQKAANGHEYALNEEVLRFLGLSNDNLFNILLFSIGGILVILVLIGSVFLIYNSFEISLNERTHQLGILMSVGATKKQLCTSVLFEGICIGSVGIPMGVLIGIPSIQFVLSLVTKNFSHVLYDNIPLTLKVSVPVLIFATVISMLTILISAYLPARKAGKLSVMECIFQTNEVKVEPKDVRTSRLLQRIYGLEGILATKNFKRNKRRYRSVILSLTLSAVLFVSASSFGEYLSQIGQQAKVVTDYDIVFYTEDNSEMDDNDLFTLYNMLKTTTGVTESTRQALATFSCELDNETKNRAFLERFGAFIDYDETNQNGNLSMDIQFLEDEIYTTFLQSLGLDIERYTGQNTDLVMVAISDQSYYLQEQPVEVNIHAPLGEETKPLRVTLVNDYPWDTLPRKITEVRDYFLMAIAPYSRKAEFDSLHAPTMMGITFRSDSPAQSIKDIQKEIQAAGITTNYTLYNVYSMLDQSRNIQFIVNLFAGLFINMISLIAVANVMNTISTNIRMRRREFAMLRSIGMSERNFHKMMRFECIFYGIWTVALGLPIAGIVSCLIYQGFFVGGGEINFSFPWESMLLSVVGVFLVIFITMLYATNKIKRENIIDGLRDDMG